MKIYLYTLIVGLLMAIGVVYYDPFEWFSSVSESVIIHDTHQLHEESMDMQGENVDHQGQHIDNQGQDNHIETGAIYEEPFIGIIFSGGIIIPGSGFVYRNEEYGFEVTLPKRWKNYEIHIQKGLDYKYREIVHVRFVFKTSDSSSILPYPISEKYMSGYADIGALIIYKMEDYVQSAIEHFKNHLPMTLEEKLEGLPNARLLEDLGNSATYKYLYGGVHDLPFDIHNMLLNSNWYEGSDNFRIL